MGEQMKCKCGQICKLKEKMFYWRGKNFNGYVCIACNALWENKEDSMFEYIKNTKQTIQW